ncbi:MAG: hypothetical protein EHM70_06080 [Chloroflexota bacterium]|nr:MAG: hypothetical protein EHM70_06080 [Chloroflexota bacterium]
MRPSPLFTRLLALLVCLTALVSCSEGGDSPAGNSQPTEAGPTLSGIGVPSEAAPVATVLPARMTEAPLPTMAVAETETEYVRIKNAALGTYIYAADEQARHGALDGADLSFDWIMEDYQGAVRFKNRSTGTYLSIENLREYVELLPVQPVWMSPRWTFDQDPASGTTIIRNAWHNWEVLYLDTGHEFLRYGRPPADAGAAQWTIELASGEAVAAGTATPVVTLPAPSLPAGSRGASVPWLEYEAEDGETNGRLIGPDRTFGTIASEASGRVAVELSAAGDYVQFKTIKEANSIVVRFVIPDAPEGDGITETLSLYVDGIFSQKLSLTSRYAWSYGGEASTYNLPVIGGAHHFFDETRLLVQTIPAGATLKLQKDPDDTAGYYIVDLVDLEYVDPPKAAPPDFLSITTDCGAVPGDGLDDGPAIQACIDEAQSRGTGVWIPAGTFESTTAAFNVDEVSIQGAGMWYSTIHGFFARFNCMGNHCQYADFAILGETLGRDDRSPENGFNNGAGLGSRLENIWVEHTKVGYWVGPGTTNGLVIINSRFRNLFADGINFCNGTSNSVVENSHFRNTGDDALASWSPAHGGVNTGNVFRFNTVQVPWRANCFAIYGGQDNRIEDNLCVDVVTYPGILIAQSFNSNPFAGTTVVQRNSLIRAGGPMFRQEHGALKIRAEQGDISRLVVKDILIDSATFSGIEIDGSYAISEAAFENIQIVNPGTWGILIRSNTSGEVTFTNVMVENPGKEALLNYAPILYFTLTRGAGNIGW